MSSICNYYYCWTMHKIVITTMLHWPGWLGWNTTPIIVARKLQVSLQHYWISKENLGGEWLTWCSGLICSEDAISEKEDRALNCFNSFQYLILHCMAHKPAELSWKQSSLPGEKLRGFKNQIVFINSNTNNLHFTLQQILINYLNHSEYFIQIRYSDSLVFWQFLSSRLELL